MAASLDDNTDSAAEETPRRRRWLRVESVGELIVALGGPVLAAPVLGTDQSGLSVWKARGWIPTQRFFVHRSTLRERGISAPERLWVQPKDQWMADGAKPSEDVASDP